MNVQQLPDPIDATAITDDPELLPASPICVRFSDATILHAYSGTAETDDGDVPCAALEFLSRDGRMFSITLDTDGLFALAEVADRLLDEVDGELETADPEEEPGAVQ